MLAFFGQCGEVLQQDSRFHGDSQGSEQVIANIRYWTGVPSQNMMCKRTLRGGLTFQLGEVSAFAQRFQVQTRHLEWPSIQSIYTYIYIYIHDIHLCFKYVLISINSCSIWLSHGVRLSGLKSKRSFDFSEAVLVKLCQFLST